MYVRLQGSQVGGPRAFGGVLDIHAGRLAAPVQWINLCVPQPRSFRKSRSQNQHARLSGLPRHAIDPADFKWTVRSYMTMYAFGRRGRPGGGDHAPSIRRQIFRLVEVSRLVTGPRTVMVNTVPLQCRLQFLAVPGSNCVRHFKLQMVPVGGCAWRTQRQTTRIKAIRTVGLYEFEGRELPNLGMFPRTLERRP
jgi:hypothetical protein